MLLEDTDNSALEILRKSRFFDAEYYYQKRPDVKNAGVDAAYHYLFHGWKEGSNPSELFCTDMYLAYNPLNVCPLVDYEQKGCRGDYGLHGATEAEILNYRRYCRRRLPFGRTACYTYVSEGYDRLLSHRHIVYDWDYICFSDDKDLLRKRYVGIWKIRPAMECRFDAKRNSGWHKTHPEKCCRFYKNSVWIDGNVNVISPYLFQEINLRNSVLLVPKHYERDCIFDECEEVKKLKRESAEKCDATINFLRRENMPRHYGLNETNIVFREHGSRLVKNIDALWWKCIKKYSKRDQLSFSYVLFKNGVLPSKIELLNTRFSVKDFLVKEHNKTPQK